MRNVILSRKEIFKDRTNVLEIEITKNGQIKTLG